MGDKKREKKGDESEKKMKELLVYFKISSTRSHRKDYLNYLVIYKL